MNHEFLRTSGNHAAWTNASSSLLGHDSLVQQIKMKEIQTCLPKKEKMCLKKSKLWFGVTYKFVQCDNVLFFFLIKRESKKIEKK